MIFVENAVFIDEVREAFMAGATRHTNWESFLEEKVAGNFTTTDLFTLRNAFMAGMTRQTNWESFALNDGLV